jgi:hypothetical protein
LTALSEDHPGSEKIFTAEGAESAEKNDSKSEN